LITAISTKLTCILKRRKYVWECSTTI